MRIEVHGGLQGDRAVFEKALAAQCDELGIALDLVKPSSGALTTPPATLVAFPKSGQAWTAAEKGDFGTIAPGRSGVLPVIVSAVDAGMLPDALKAFNAFQTGLWGAAWADGLVDEVLSHSWQHRRERRVFISYKRSESGRVAKQLFEALSYHGYVPFLDDVSIPKGDDFQHELKWWLNDADAILLLLTPGFANSQWCMQEVNFARGSSVGLLGIEWPDSDFPTPARAPDSVATSIDSDQRLQLQDADFAGDARRSHATRELSEAGLLRVIVHCARQRALAIRQRLDDLVPLATELLAPSAAMRPVAGMAGDFTFSDSSGSDYYVRIVPFRPDPRCMHETFQAASGQRYVGCLYGEFDVHDPRATALKWLAQCQREGKAPNHELRLWACLGDKVIA